MSKVSVIGIGPGEYEQMTLKAIRGLEEAEIIIGYTVYIKLIEEHFPNKTYMQTPMRQEVKRCEMAFEEAAKGKNVAMICSGDAGVYGMAGLIYEVGESYPQVSIEIIPGVTSALGGGAVLGAPLMHDFALISLSDCLTEWDTIAKRLNACAESDFVVCLYNPSSKRRHDFLQKACDIMLVHKKESTPCGIVRNIGREGESYEILTLAELRNTAVDMFTTVFIGNSSTVVLNNKMVTKRGYIIKGHL